MIVRLQPEMADLAADRRMAVTDLGRGEGPKGCGCGKQRRRPMADEKEESSALGDLAHNP
jgi:hypothetical protein